MPAGLSRCRSAFLQTCRAHPLSPQRLCPQIGLPRSFTAYIFSLALLESKKCFSNLDVPVSPLNICLNTDGRTFRWSKAVPEYLTWSHAVATAESLPADVSRGFYTESVYNTMLYSSSLCLLSPGTNM